MTQTETETVQVRAHDCVVKKLGDWTTARRFDVRASHGMIVLDLVLPKLEPGEIEIALDLDHAVVKLLVPTGNTIDDELRCVGRGRSRTGPARHLPAGLGSSSSARCATPRCGFTAEASSSSRCWHTERQAYGCARRIARGDSASRDQKGENQ